MIPGNNTVACKGKIVDVCVCVKGNNLTLGSITLALSGSV